MVIITRTVLNIVVPHVTLQPLVMQLTNVYLSNVTTIITGDTALISAPIKTAQFVLHQGTSWVTVCSNVFLHHRHPQSMEDLPLLHANPLSDGGLIIKSRTRLYGGGNITILLLFCHTMLISFNTSCRYWRGLCPSNISYLLIFRPTSIFLLCI